MSICFAEQTEEADEEVSESDEVAEMETEQQTVSDNSNQIEEVKQRKGKKKHAKTAAVSKATSQDGATSTNGSRVAPVSNQMTEHKAKKHDKKSKAQLKQRRFLKMKIKQQMNHKHTGK